MSNSSVLNTSAAGLIQVLREKTAGLHMALHENFSGLVSGTDPVEVSKRFSKSCSLQSKKFLG